MRGAAFLAALAVFFDVLRAAFLAVFFATFFTARLAVFVAAFRAVFFAAFFAVLRVTLLAALRAVFLTAAFRGAFRATFLAARLRGALRGAGAATAVTASGSDAATVSGAIPAIIVSFTSFIVPPVHWARAHAGRWSPRVGVSAARRQFCRNCDEEYP